MPTPLAFAFQLVGSPREGGHTLPAFLNPFPDRLAVRAVRLHRRIQHVEHLVVETAKVAFGLSFEPRVQIVRHVNGQGGRHGLRTTR